MPACNATKSGEVYVCAACGFEIQVLKLSRGERKGCLLRARSLLSRRGAALALKK